MYLFLLGFKDLVVVGGLFMKAPMFFTKLFPLGTCHTLNTLDPFHMYRYRYCLLGKLILCDLYI